MKKPNIILEMKVNKKTGKRELENVSKSNKKRFKKKVKLSDILSQDEYSKTISTLNPVVSLEEIKNRLNLKGV